MARRVVVAAGIGPFAHRPQPFASLPSELVSHAVDHDDLGKFRGKRVLVVGRGQSALESAALLHENDAQVQVVFQNGAVHWLTRSARLHRMGAITKLLYAPTDIGPAGVSRLVAAPGWFRSFPRSAQQKMGVMSIRPAGAAWLIPRLRDVPLLTDAAAVEAKATAGGVSVATADGRSFEADHVLLGTGYRVDVARYGFLGPEVLAGLRRTNGYPHLDRGFESSVAGLHFVGAPAAWSFGPLMRFVAGTKFAADRTSRRIAGRSAARVSRALNVAPSTEG
jgi:cation diffusion facilitator CzcD-associated flavoprotein CzcO